MTSIKDEVEIGVAIETGGFLMLDKKERKLVKSILAKAMSSKAAEKLIAEKLGKDYIKLGRNLLEQMGAD